MHTIKQAAARTGLTIPTIRAWERRYGVIQPNRTAAGYRLYDDASIARLLAMRRLIDVEGWRPSQAADAVLAAGSDLAGLGRGAPTGAADPVVDAEATPSRRSDAVVATFVQAAIALDVPAMEWVLDEAFAGQRFESAMGTVVFPALRAIGEAWAAGEIDVAGEHVASELVERRMAHLFDAARRADRGPSVIVGLPPGGHHELGAFGFAIAARRAGIDVLYLGADVPLESWVRTAAKATVRVAVQAVVTLADVGPATRVIESLQAQPDPVFCAIGGSFAADVRPVGGLIVLPESLDLAVEVVAGILAGDPVANGRR